MKRVYLHNQPCNHRLTHARTQTRAHARTQTHAHTHTSTNTNTHIQPSTPVSTHKTHAVMHIYTSGHFFSCLRFSVYVQACVLACMRASVRAWVVDLVDTTIWREKSIFEMEENWSDTGPLSRYLLFIQRQLSTVAHLRRFACITFAAHNGAFVCEGNGAGHYFPYRSSAGPEPINFLVFISQ